MILRSPIWHQKIHTGPTIKGPPSLPVSCHRQGNNFMFLSPPSSLSLISFFMQHSVITSLCYRIQSSNVWYWVAQPQMSYGWHQMKSVEVNHLQSPPPHVAAGSAKPILHNFRHIVIVTIKVSCLEMILSSLWSKSCHGQHTHQWQVQWCGYCQMEPGGEYVGFWKKKTHCFAINKVFGMNYCTKS